MFIKQAETVMELNYRARRWLRGLDPGRVAAFLALALVLTAALGLRFRMIEKGMPYPQHIDETYLSDKGAAILKTGDFNPHFFMYPALPIYLTAAAMTYGYLDAANHLELQSTREIGLVGYPYYEHPRVVRPARRLFALLSVAAMALVAWLAYRFGGLVAMLAAPALLGLSTLYFEQSQAYLNVNIVGCAFSWATLALVIHFFERPDWMAKVAAPGLLGGLTIACKYNFAAVLLAPLLAILFAGGTRKPAKAAALLGLAGAAFLAVAPYTLLDFKTFLDDLGKTTFVYRQGEFSQPGSATFLGHFVLCMKDLARDFGTATGLFAALGAVVLVRRAPRQALIVAVFPALLLLQMCRTPTHLMRNLVPFLPFLALAAALGFAAAATLLAAWLGRRDLFGAWPARRREALAGATLFAGAALLLPIGAPLAWLKTPLGSRQEAVAWLRQEAPPGGTILVASELGLHPGELREAGFEVAELPLRTTSRVAFLAQMVRHPEALMLLPRSNAEHWDPKVVAKHEGLLPHFASLLTEVETLREFGSAPVSVCFDFPSGGDPQFVAARARLSPSALSELAGGRLLLPEHFQGALTQHQEGGLAILARTRVLSREVTLPAGAYRLEIGATGSPVQGRYPVVRTSFAGSDLGRFEAATGPGLAVFDFTLEAPARSPLELELLNDEIERDAAGQIVADRNVWLQGALFSPLASAP